MKAGAQNTKANGVKKPSFTPVGSGLLKHGVHLVGQSPPLVQAKLKIGYRYDHFEQQADRVADRVVRMAPGNPGQGDAQEETISISRPKPVANKRGAQSLTAPAWLTHTIQDGESGTPLSASIRRTLESRMGVHLGGVRIHDDSHSHVAANALQARAFTRKNEIWLGKGESQHDLHLMAHEVTHVMQQDGVLRRKPASSTRITPPEKGIKVDKIGVVSNKSGVILRNQPLPYSTVLKTLPFNTRLFLDREPEPGWYLVVLSNGEHGYVVKRYVANNPLDPEAELYSIPENQGAQSIAKKFYAKAVVHGQDERFFVNILYDINYRLGRKGIYKENENDSWDKVKTQKGAAIWIPTLRYAKSRADKVESGSISHEALEILKAGAKAVGKFYLYEAVFVAGVFRGIGDSILDLLGGLLELGWDVLYSVFSGNFIPDAIQLLKDLQNVRMPDLEKIFAGWVSSFKGLWNNPDPITSWHFRGRAIGYLIAEIVMLTVSGGVLTGLKILGKGGKVAKLLRALSVAAVQIGGKAKKTGKAVSSLKKALSKKAPKAKKPSKKTKTSQDKKKKEKDDKKEDENKTFRRFKKKINEDSTIRKHWKWGIAYNTLNDQIIPVRRLPPFKKVIRRVVISPTKDRSYKVRAYLRRLKGPRRVISIRRLPTGLTRKEAIPIHWYKKGHPSTIPLSPMVERWTRRGRTPPTGPTSISMLRRNDVEVPPTQIRSFQGNSNSANNARSVGNRRVVKLGVAGNYMPKIGKKMQKTPSGSARPHLPMQGKIRKLLENYNYPWTNMESDHVQDFAWGGISMDNLRNLWPLSASANNAGNRTYRQKVQYQENNDYREAQPDGRYMGRIMNGKYFKIKSKS